MRYTKAIMSWAAQRRLVVLLIVGSFIAAIASTILIASFYEAPSCGDGIQNQDETGIDCGGSCAFLCTADMQPPTILFTKPLSSIPGRTDVIASIENKNATAGAKDVPYTVAVYDANRTLLQEARGTLDLPPGATVPLYIPGVVSGKHTAVTAFVSINGPAIMWYRLAQDPRILPKVSNITLGGQAGAPRVTATLSNTTVTPLRNVKAVVVVRDGAGNVIGASQTVVPLVPGQGQATATFTWGSAFSTLPVSIEVTPIILLP